MFADYTHITCPLYSFNIDAIEGDPDATTGDDRVGATVSEIMNVFFSKKNNVAVYVCDSLDERQYARKRKFDLWFYSYNDGTLIKEDGLAIVEGAEIYNAMLLHKQNEQLTEVILAFKELNERAGDK
jgi:dihydroxyacetone kinase DhaKLM complex PTS-EIIA-like component DhaM